MIDEKVIEAAREELPGCPFDDGQGLHGTKVNSNGGRMAMSDVWWVQCKCGAEGPNARSPAEAKIGWSRRALSLDAGGEDNANALVIRQAATVGFHTGIETAARWHDKRFRDTPDAFEMELHQASAKALRALPGLPSSADARHFREDEMSERVRQ